ncbi:MAG: response regulator transcription factor [Deinococcus sp.]|nr:response regulator transcription factor [Deinococcus sp.]
MATARNGKITVLIADDHAMVRDGTRRILEGQSDMVVVDEAANGSEAVERALSSRPMVVLMDLQMPVMNGLEATKKIKAALPETAVLVLTAYDDDQYVFAILEAGAAGYLLKTVRGSELVSAIRAVRAGESVLHPSVARKVVTRLAHRAHPQAPDLDRLTDRETEVLRCAAAGASNKQIASTLGVSPRTVQAHLSNIFSKMQVASRVEAIIKGIQLGILQVPADHSSE